MSFAQLQTLTSYSLLSSTNRISELVKKAKTFGYSTLGITDLNVLYGAIEFYQACKKEKIQPLIGLTLDYCIEGIEEAFQLIFFAKGLIGYQNLLQISSMKMELPANQRLFFSNFEAYLEDLILITPEERGELEYLVEKSKIEEAKTTYAYWKSLLPREDIYAGIHSLSISSMTYELQAQWKNFCVSENLPLVALQKVCYLNPSDDFSLRVLEHIEEGTQISLDHSEVTGTRFLPAAEDIEEKFIEMNLTEASLRTLEIAKKCQLDLPLHQKLLPHYPVPENIEAANYLRSLCFECLPKRIAEPDQRYINRLNMELEVIHEMGFDDYFLIVWDVMDFAHRSQIVTGAGRGSAAGSLVSYVLSITDVDPIAYDLLFERFLNSERYTMPDIDLDIPDNRREEVLQYVTKKYGFHRVAQIATFGTMAAKMALRDVARVFGLSQSESNQWSNAIPNVLKVTLDEAYKTSIKLQKMVESSEKNHLLFETARKIEGLPRHVSTHAAGVVISDQELTQFLPLQEGSNGIPLTQFAMGDVEAIGLLKMDFLGLRNLSIMDNTLQQIKRIYKKDVLVSDIPLDDEKTLELFRQGKTTGIFQFESAGIRNVLRRLQPTSIEDIAAVNALYRPGPMENIDLFIKRKKGQVPIEYPHESLQPILEKTYGVMVYQEQVMQVASKMGGFTLGQADILRRAISKKKKEVIDEERNHFVKGAETQGYSLDTASTVYDYIERFANYGFNRSHAVAYSFIGYQMAYLKVHYPAPFFAALLHSMRHNSSKIKEYINEARKYSLSIRPPDINRSQYSFSLAKNEILFGFSSLKGIRRDFIANLLEERKLNGQYQSLENFLLRIDRKWLKADHIIPLILVGAFDSLTKNRRQLMKDLDGIIKNIQYSGGSLDLLEMMSLKEDEIEDYALEEKLDQEEKYLGTYLSGHPVEEFQIVHFAKQTQEISQLVAGEKAKILLYVKEIRTIRTKKGESMAFLEGNDLTGSISVTAFPRVYRQMIQQVDENQVVYVEGKVEVSKYNQETQILAEKIINAKTMKEKINLQTCYLKISSELPQEEINKQIYQVLKKHSGNVPVVLFYERTDKKLVLHDENWINDSQEVKNELCLVLGKSNVVFK